MAPRSAQRGWRHIATMAKGCDSAAAERRNEELPDYRPYPAAAVTSGGRVAATCGNFLFERLADTADFGCHQRTILDLQEVAFALLAIVRRQFLDFADHRMDTGYHRLTFFGGVREFDTERFDFFHRRVVFADHSFGREFADLIDAFLVLDVIGHRV